MYMTNTRGDSSPVAITDTKIGVSRGQKIMGDMFQVERSDKYTRGYCDKIKNTHKRNNISLIEKWNQRAMRGGGGG